MYRLTEQQLILPDGFFLPFGGKLNKENRWVILAGLIPWWKVEEKYAKKFKKTFRGQKAVSVRVALGALIIQQRLNTSDRETVQQITENPYLQYFIGLPSFQEVEPFHHSLMTHFRKRLDKNIINEMNKWIALNESNEDSPNDPDDNDPPSDSSSSSDVQEDTPSTTPPSNQGKLLLDATCAPADIAYPTDLSLLNEAREKLENLVDLLHAPQRGHDRKPRTYRQKARKAYLAVAKQRRANPRVIRKAIAQQLRFVARNLRTVAILAEQSGLSQLNRHQYKQLLVIQELYRQHNEMYAKRSHRIEDRIVNLSQPHVRPIVRGKAKANVEFGAKIAISLVNGCALLEKLQWDNFNEGNTLQESVEAYHERYGYYPEAVLADQIYRNRENLNFCKERGIRLSGPALGRPSEKERKKQKRQARQDSSERNAIEGKFGEGKRRYGLGRIRAHLQSTSETVISLQLLVMNLENRLRVLFYLFFRSLFYGLADVCFC